MQKLSFVHLLLGLALARSEDSCLARGGACAGAQQGESQTDVDDEAELLKVSLLQTGMTSPSRVTKADDRLQLFQEGDTDQGIWDTLGGMFKSAAKDVGYVQKKVLDTIVNQTDAALDKFDEAVNKLATQGQDYEKSFVTKANASITEHVAQVKTKVRQMTSHTKDMWHMVKNEVVSLQRIIVGTLSTVGQADSAIKLNSTMISLLDGVDSAGEATLKVGQAAESLTVESASCGALKLNETLDAATTKVVSLKLELDSGFEAVNRSLSSLAHKLPNQLMAPVLKAVESMEKRGLESSGNLLKVYQKTAGYQIDTINKLQAQCLTEGKGCGSGGIFSNIKAFFKKLLHR